MISNEWARSKCNHNCFLRVKQQQNNNNSEEGGFRNNHQTDCKTLNDEKWISQKFRLFDNRRWPWGAPWRSRWRCCKADKMRVNDVVWGIDEEEIITLLQIENYAHSPNLPNQNIGDKHRICHDRIVPRLLFWGVRRKMPDCNQSTTKAAINCCLQISINSMIESAPRIFWARKTSNGICDARIRPSQNCSMSVEIKKVFIEKTSCNDWSRIDLRNASNRLCNLIEWSNWAIAISSATKKFFDSNALSRNNANKCSCSQKKTFF